MNNRGFTLVELIVVVVIIGIVGGIAAPSVLNSLNIGKKSSDMVLYSNIKGAMKTMYEEIYYSGSSLYKYNKDGKTDEVIVISDDSFSVNVQTLVSNGFLSGITNYNEDDENKNKKIVLDSENEDIGECEVSILKKKDGNKVYYIVSGSDMDGCPSDDDLGE